LVSLPLAQEVEKVVMSEVRELCPTLRRSRLDRREWVGHTMGDHRVGEGTRQGDVMEGHATRRG